MELVTLPKGDCHGDIKMAGFKIEFTDEEMEGMLKSLYENLPEASAGSGLDCIEFDYDNFYFEFHDEEEDIQRKIDKSMAIEGLRKMLHDALIGKIKIYERDEWDADTVMIAVQYAIFGKVIYG
jgi:hypothetical protein